MSPCLGADQFSAGPTAQPRPRNSSVDAADLRQGAAVRTSHPGIEWLAAERRADELIAIKNTTLDVAETTVPPLHAASSYYSLHVFFEL